MFYGIKLILMLAPALILVLAVQDVTSNQPDAAIKLLAERLDSETAEKLQEFEHVVLDELKNSPSPIVAAKRLRERRQSDEDLIFLLCLFQYYGGLLNNTACNVTAPNATDYKTTNEYYTALNAYYAAECLPQCLQLTNQLYQCIQLSAADLQFLNYALEHVICARITTNGDFCPVHYLRVYKDEEDTEVNKIYKTCGDYEPLSDDNSDPKCDMSNCRDLAQDFTTNMGCCSVGYLGNVTRCVDNPPNACNFVNDSAYGLVYSVVPVVVTLTLSTIFSVLF